MKMIISNAISIAPFVSSYFIKIFIARDIEKNKTRFMQRNNINIMKKPI